MTQQTIEIEGLPEGWKAVAYRCPLKGEQYLHQNQLWKAFIDESYPFIVVEKTQTRRIVLEEIQTGFGVENPKYFDDKIWKQVKE